MTKPQAVWWAMTCQVAVTKAFQAFTAKWKPQADAVTEISTLTDVGRLTNPLEVAKTIILTKINCGGLKLAKEEGLTYQEALAAHKSGVRMLRLFFGVPALLLTAVAVRKFFKPWLCAWSLTRRLLGRNRFNDLHLYSRQQDRHSQFGSMENKKSRLCCMLNRKQNIPEFTKLEHKSLLPHVSSTFVQQYKFILYIYIDMCIYNIYTTYVYIYISLSIYVHISLSIWDLQSFIWSCLKTKDGRKAHSAQQGQ